MEVQSCKYGRGIRASSCGAAGCSLRIRILNLTLNGPKCGASSARSARQSISASGGERQRVKASESWLKRTSSHTQFIRPPHTSTHARRCCLTPSHTQRREVHERRGSLLLDGAVPDARCRFIRQQVQQLHGAAAASIRVTRTLGPRRVELEAH